MQRIYNSVENREIVTIMPGEYYISTEKELIGTLLGSCISVCLFDKEAGIGGMNHFLLPSISDAKQSDDPTLYASVRSRYGVTAMETLILEMQLKGAVRERMKAKVFGGGNVLRVKITSDPVGERNIRFINEYLKTERIPVVNSDTGEEFTRKVLFNTGDFTVRLTKTPTNSEVARDEEAYMQRISKMQKDTQIIFF